MERFLLLGLCIGLIVGAAVSLVVFLPDEREKVYRKIIKSISNKDVPLEGEALFLGKGYVIFRDGEIENVFIKSALRISHFVEEVK